MRVTMVFDEVILPTWCPICGQKLDPKNLGSGCGHLYNIGGYWIEFRSEEEAK